MFLFENLNIEKKLNLQDWVNPIEFANANKPVALERYFENYDWFQAA